jgi:ferredoxin-thioredoxin reductase catalytic chain
MMEEYEIAQTEIDTLYMKLDKEAREGGYNLNPDLEMTKDLVRGLIVNGRRYGYWNCPCRLATGVKAEDLDIICPCDYRDADVSEYGACYCALYVSDEVVAGKKKAEQIPERRPSDEERKMQSGSQNKIPSGLPYPVWRCKVCGYLCARGQPPLVCPICKAKQDRFEKFL